MIIALCFSPVKKLKQKFYDLFCVLLLLVLLLQILNKAFVLHTVAMEQSFDVFQVQIAALDLEQEGVLRLRNVQIIEPVSQDGVGVGRAAAHVREALREGNDLLRTLGI
jgi:hypothetical protein